MSGAQSVFFSTDTWLAAVESMSVTVKMSVSGSYKFE